MIGSGTDLRRTWPARATLSPFFLVFSPGGDTVDARAHAQLAPVLTPSSVERGDRQGEMAPRVTWEDVAGGWRSCRYAISTAASAFTNHRLSVGDQPLRLTWQPKLVGQVLKPRRFPSQQHFRASSVLCCRMGCQRSTEIQDQGIFPLVRRYLR